jgi:hypothetical protein
MINNTENDIESIHVRLINAICYKSNKKYPSERVKSEDFKKFGDIASSMVVSLLRSMEDNRHNININDKLPSILNEVSNLLHWLQVGCYDKNKLLIDECASICSKVAINIEEENSKRREIDNRKIDVNPLMILTPGCPYKEDTLGDNVQNTTLSSPRMKY